MALIIIKEQNAENRHAAIIHAHITPVLIGARIFEPMASARRLVSNTIRGTIIRRL